MRHVAGMATSTPFTQPLCYFEMTCELPQATAEHADLYFEDMALSVAAFEVDEARALWKLTVLMAEAPEPEDIARRLALMGVDVPYRLEPRVQKDWVAALAQEFPPLTVGRFFVHGGHIQGKAPPGAIALQIEAGAAFGSGEHATTSGCLRALLEVRRRERRPLRVLDMGTGSGILAIAAAKLLPASQVMAVDVDVVSVRVAAENARINRVPRVRVAQANGYHGKEIVSRAGGYDMILANILARPLCRMAPYAARALAPKGMLILSGLLTEQERMVLHAHRLQGLILARRFQDNGWSTLLMVKP